MLQVVEKPRKSVPYETDFLMGRYSFFSGNEGVSGEKCYSGVHAIRIDGTWGGLRISAYPSGGLPQRRAISRCPFHFA
jgi:hypothetical protein